MNQISSVLNLMSESLKTAFKHPAIFLYLSAYFVLNFIFVQPYLGISGQTPLIRGSINIILSLLLFVAFICAIVLTIKHTYAVLHNTSLSVSGNAQSLGTILIPLISYLLILGFYLAVTGSLAFFVSYKATIPSDVSFSQLLQQVSASGQAGLAQHTINFLLMLATLYSISIMFWMFATFFVLPSIALEGTSIIQALSRSWSMTRKHIVPVLGGIIVTVLFLYAGDYVLSFARQPVLNAFFFYAVITIVTIYSTLLFVRAKKTLYTGHTSL